MTLSSLEGFYYVFSLLANALFLCLAIFILWRMEKSADHVSSSVGNSAKLGLNTFEAFQRLTKEFKGLVEDQKRWSSDFKMWTKVFMEASDRSIGADVNPDAGQLDAESQASLQRLSEVVGAIDLEMLRVLTKDLDELVRTFTEQAENGEGSQATRANANDLKTHRDSLRREVEQFQERLDESNRVIFDLRRENRTAYTSISALETLRQNNERLFGELKSRRDQVLQLDSRLEKMSKALEDLSRAKSVAQKTNVTAEKAASPDQDDVELRSRLLSAETDLKKLVSELDDASAAMERAMREKKMVEDRLLEILES